MKPTLLFCVLIFLILGVTFLEALPTPTPQKPSAGTSNKGAFNPAFDEIVVESSLTVRGKSPGARQGRKLVVVPANESITVKTSLSSQSQSSTTAPSSSTTTSSTSTSTTSSS